MPSQREPLTTINISTLAFIKVLIVIAVVGFLYLIRDILAIVFIALLFASALSPWVATMQGHRIPRRLGVLLIYLSILTVISLTIVLIVPPIVQEYNQLVTVFPTYSDNVIQFVQSMSPEINVIEYVKTFLKSIESNLPHVASIVFVKIFDVLQGLVALVIVCVVTFYMIAEEGVIKRTIQSLAPQKYHESIDILIIKIQKKIGLWLRGQSFLCLIIGTLSFIGLSVLKVEYALILGLIAGLTEFIPVLGPILGSIPAIFIAFNQSPILAVFVFLLYFIIQRIENDFLVPTVMSKTVGVNPLVSIIALLIGGKLGGFVGMLLAIPVVTVIGVIVEYFFGEDHKQS